MDKELKNKLNELYIELEKSNDSKQKRIIIAKAVQLGMKYQEEKIKKGINIVFSELNK